MEVEGLAPGLHEVTLYDAGTGAVLDSGHVTLLGAGGQEVPTVVAAPEPPILLAALIGVVLGVAIGIGVLHVTGKLPKIGVPRFKLPKIKMPSVRLPRGRVPRPAPPTPPTPPPGVEREELDEESTIVQTYHDILMPVAREIAARKRVKHLGRAVKPYKKKRS